MAALTPCSGIDNTFGPSAGGCRGGFDFTLLFEESILTLLPLALFLSVSPARIYYLLGKQTKVHRSRIVILKLSLYAVYGALQLALLVLWAGLPQFRTQASVPTAAVTFLSCLVLPLVSYAEHDRTVRPSSLLGAYLSSTLLFDIARTRTLWLQHYSYSIAAITAVSVLAKLALLLVESAEKRRLLLSKFLACSPQEATAGIFNRLFFIWLNGLFRRGFSSYLKVDDLFTLDKHLSAEYLEQAVKSAWVKVNVKSPNSLLFTFFKTFKWALLSIVFPRLCLIGCNFAQPFLINNAIDLSLAPVTDQTTNTGYGLIGAYILVYTGIAVSTSQYQHLTFRAITMARGGLISMLYSKTSELSITAVNPSASLTLMSADIERITNGWQSMNEIWANGLEVALAIWLLERQLGAACALPVGVAIVSVGGSVVMTNYIMSSQAVWLEAIERRIEATTAMLGSMKGVKMCGLTEILMTNIHNLRIEELQISKKFRRLLVWNLAFAYFTPIIGPILTFAVYSALARNANDGTSLDTSRAFTSMSLFALLADPLSALIMAVAQFAGSIGSFSRIQEFLDGAVREDKRSCADNSIASDRDSQSSHAKSSYQNSEIENEKVPTVTAKAKSSLQSIIGQTTAIMVQDGRFGWTQESHDLLSNINLSVPRGKLTFVVGPVGCGKSTLLKALLGEVPYTSGSVYIGVSRVAFCDQTPWHMNGTIEQSILAVSDMDLPWYKAVIRACALDEDLRQLPKGDQTLIGSKGIALSGGQSQRIALARAIYSQKDLFILDDVFSGLDATTENMVFHNLLGTNGLLRRLDATVVVASSSSKRLAFADLIVALDAHGKIAEQGDFNELDKLGGYVSSFGLGVADWGSLRSRNYSNESVNDEKKHSGDESGEKPAVEAAVVEFDDGRASGDAAIYLYYIRSVGWFATLVFVVAISIYAFAWTFPTVWVKWWAEANSVAPNANLGYWLGIYALLGVGAIVSLIVCVWQMLITMVPKSGENFHLSLLKTVLHAPMSFFTTTDTGVTLNRFSQDLQLIDMDLPLAALNTVATLVLCIAQMALIGVESIYAAASFPICIVAVYFIQRFYLRTSRQIRYLDLEAKSPLYSQFVECLNGLATIRAFGWQNALARRGLVLLDRSQRPFYLMYAIQRWLILVLELLVAAIAVLLIVLVVVLRGQISAGAVGVALVNVILFSQNIQLLLQFWTTMETHIGAITRIKKFTDNTRPEDLPQEKDDPPATWPSSGAIEFENVSAAYGASEPVVKKVTLSIEAGQKVAICGRTGSGKSSLIASLFRMIDVTDGTIHIDRVDISKVHRQQVRSRINGVPQESYVLRGSVRFNADPTEAATDAAIMEALKSVHLWDVIEAKGGLDASIEKVFLSHGQKQLFSLARAMLRPSTILVLDEATSSVDSKTDEVMQRVIRQKFSHHTIIAVAHKLDTILDFDNVAVLDRGTLVEYDSPHKLLAKKQSEFSRLFHSFQAGQKDGEGIDPVT